MELNTLRTLYVDNLKDMLNAERQLVKALPRMVKGASNPDLRIALDEHLAATVEHVSSIEQILLALDEGSRGKKCKGMEGLIEEGAEILEAGGDPDVIDAGLIVAAQKVEHYEIVAYGSLRTFAEILGERSAATVLAELLGEEKEADARLNEIALSMVNPEAVISR